MKTSFAICFEAFRNRSVRSLFKGAVASFCDVISVKISLLYTKKKVNQICRFCNFFSLITNIMEEKKDVTCWATLSNIEVSNKFCVYF